MIIASGILDGFDLLGSIPVFILAALLGAAIYHPARELIARQQEHFRANVHDYLGDINGLGDPGFFHIYRIVDLFCYDRLGPDGIVPMDDPKTAQAKTASPA